MGNISSYISSEKAFTIYKRRIDTDAYDPEPTQTWNNITKASAFGQFKHEMYAYALGKYVYNNNTQRERKREREKREQYIPATI